MKGITEANVRKKPRQKPDKPKKHPRVKRKQNRKSKWTADEKNACGGRYTEKHIGRPIVFESCRKIHCKPSWRACFSTSSSIAVPP